MLGVLCAVLFGLYVVSMQRYGSFVPRPIDTFLAFVPLTVLHKLIWKNSWLESTGTAAAAAFGLVCVHYLGL